MGLFDIILKAASSVISERSQREPGTHGLMDYGRTKDTGGHDHRDNRGDDRTPAQKIADRARRGPRK
ncbi:hypothetical protein GFK26_18260 [Variovorax paradoxus]|uniref:Uncharacterized protein n=1 Tax=Variovorax paradoxus TaxID=34073 RepID=A0A5Q0M856_VARPD|nr:hypothetical protein GFK26_18260 [Variovorax paradoxus]